MTDKRPPVLPGEILRYVERTCASCGIPFRVLYRRDGRYKRLCRACRECRSR